ncbi:inner membrane protein yphA [Escherichia coli KTE102]|nr:inner membrane protein yphA [Escherichia coli KTE102]
MNTLRYFDFGAARPVLLLIARIAVVLIFIIFGFPKMMGFDGTVQYMASLGAPMPMLAAIIAVVMEVPAAGNDSNLLIVFYVQIMPDDFVMQLHRF